MKLINKFLFGITITVLVFANQLAYSHGNDGHDHGKVKEIPQLPFSLDFIENNGQWEDEVKYKAILGSASIFITENGFVYNIASQDDLDNIHEKTCGIDVQGDVDLSNEIIRHHAYRVKFEGSNKNATFNPELKRKNYHNYFIGNDESKWAGKVGLYGKVNQTEIYSGVNLSVYSSGQSLKYDFIVSAGSNPNQIKISFDGVKPILAENGDLIIPTSIYEIIEKAPYTYQIINDQKVVIKSNYIFDKEGHLSFEFPDGYNSNYDLIIDPELVFATFSGSTGGNNYSYATGFDSDGSMFAAASCWAGGWPVTLGAFQQTHTGSLHCVSVNKYTPDGLGLIFSTYFGGNVGGYTLPCVVKGNHANELLLAGTTQSTNLPVTSNAFQTTSQGNWDLYVTHFSFDGSALIGSTYVGTSAADGYSLSGPGALTSVNTPQNTPVQNLTSPVDITYDNAGNIWVCSTTPGNNFPLTSNAFQLTYGGGSTDGVVFSLDPTCTNLLFSSYAGGSGDDYVHSIFRANNGRIIIAGATTSSDYNTTTGVINPVAPGGGLDGFVTVFVPATGLVVASSYVGTTMQDQLSHVYCDASNNIYVMGRTLGTYPLNPTNAFTFNVGQMNVFIDKFDDSLKTSINSTRFGCDNSIFPTAFMVDICNNVYVAFLSNSMSNQMPLTQDHFVMQHANSDEFWFGVLNENFTELLYGSYFGAAGNDHTHKGLNCLDPSGNVYHSVCASSGTGGWNDATYPANVFAPIKTNSGQDIISFKFNFDKAGVNAEFKLDPNTNSKDSGCVPFTVNFANNSTQAVDFYWDFGDGGTSTLQNPTHTYMSPGTYTIELMTVNDTACVTHDTAYYTVYVFQLDTPKLVTRDTVLCNPENSLDISVEILNPSSNILGNTIKWTSTPPGGIIGADSTDTITVNPSIATTYTVTVWDSIPHLCSTFGTAQVNIDLSPRELEIYTNDTTVCYGDTIQVSAKGTAGYTYKWSPTTGVLDTTALEPKIVVTQPTVYILTSSYPFCLDTSVMFQVDVEYYPVVTIDAPKEACRYTEVILNSNISPFRNDYTYTWTPNINLSNNNLPNTILTADTTVNYKLTVSTPAGCTGSDEVSIAVHPGNFGDAISDMGYCPPGELELWATGGVKYRWSPSIGLSNDTIYNPKTNVSTTTEYQVIITDANNCEDTFNVIVTVYPLAVLSLPDSVVIHKGESYRVEPATNCLYFNWFPPSGVSDPQTSDPELSPLVRTKYYVTASTENGCETTDSMIVMVDGSKFDVPNAFAPGKGNVFKPIKRGDATLNSFTVYNRWGNKIFETKNIDEGWDGTFNGTEQSAGVYVYIVDAVAKDGEQIKMQGNVTLVR